MFGFNTLASTTWPDLNSEIISMFKLFLSALISLKSEALVFIRVLLKNDVIGYQRHFITFL